MNRQAINDLAQAVLVRTKLDYLNYRHYLSNKQFDVTGTRLRLGELKRLYHFLMPDSSDLNKWCRILGGRSRDFLWGLANAKEQGVSAEELAVTEDLDFEEAELLCGYMVQQGKNKPQTRDGLVRMLAHVKVCLWNGGSIAQTRDKYGNYDDWKRFLAYLVDEEYLEKTYEKCPKTGLNNIFYRRCCDGER